MTRSSKKSPSVKNTPRHLEPVGSHGGPGRALSDEELLEILADTINSLRKRVAEDLVEIGFRLTEAKALVGHGGWLPWLERSFGWTERTAQRYMSVYELMTKYDIMSDLDLPMTTLVQLAAPSTPPEAIETVIDRTGAGEKLTGADVKKEIDKAKGKKSTKEARQPDPLTPHRPKNLPLAALSRTEKRNEIAKMNADIDARIERRKAERLSHSETAAELASELDAAKTKILTGAEPSLELSKAMEILEETKSKILLWGQMTTALENFCKEHGRDGLKEVIKVLIEQYGYDAVSDAVLEHTK
jgi:Protein of unknown function (DUF3102)